MHGSACNARLEAGAPALMETLDCAAGQKR
jgi:hypothetical protein